MPRTLATPYAVYSERLKVLTFSGVLHLQQCVLALFYKVLCTLRAFYPCFIGFIARHPSFLLWHDTQSVCRLSTRSLPPLLLGMMWSTCAALPLTTRKHTRHW